MKKEMLIPTKVIAIMFFLTLFLCLMMETEADRFIYRKHFCLVVIIWQVIFGLLALAKIKRPTFFYFFSTLFLLPAVLTAFVLSYLILYPFIVSNQVFAVSIMLMGAALNFYLSYLGFGNVFKETLEDNIASGKFDLSKGLFSFSISPKMLDYKNPRQKRIATFLMMNLGVIAFIGPIIGFYVNRSPNTNFKDLCASIGCYLMAMVFGWAVSGSFYNYRWIRSWEKGSGKEMVTRNV